MKKILKAFLGILFLIDSAAATAGVVIVAPIHHRPRPRHRRHYRRPAHAAVVLKLGDAGYHDGHR